MNNKRRTVISLPNIQKALANSSMQEALRLSPGSRILGILRMNGMITNIPDVLIESSDEVALMEFWSLAHRPSRDFAAAIFPEKPLGYIRLTKDLANYASNTSNTSTAVMLRKQGDIARAMYYEAIAQRIYQGLPDDVRW